MDVIHPRAAPSSLSEHTSLQLWVVVVNEVTILRQISILLIVCVITFFIEIGFGCIYADGDVGN